MITALADFIIMSVWLRLKLFSKCSFDLELGLVSAKMDKMRRPDDFDNAEEEEYVDEDGEDGGDGEKVDTVALVHPAKFVFIHHSEVKDLNMSKDEKLDLKKTVETKICRST